MADEAIVTPVNGNMVSNVSSGGLVEELMIFDWRQSKRNPGLARGDTHAGIRRKRVGVGNDTPPLPSSSLLSPNYQASRSIVSAKVQSQIQPSNRADTHQAFFVDGMEPLQAVECD